MLTPLFNRLPAVASGDVLTLDIGGERHPVEVLSVRGLPYVRCGRPGEFEFGNLDVNAALGSLEPAAQTPAPVPAACIVDADVEVEFVPSAAAAQQGDSVAGAGHAAEGDARAAAFAAEATRARAAEQAASEKAAKGDRWSVTNAGEGHVLGGTAADAADEPDGGGTSPVSQQAASDGSQREKRLAALQRRGL